MNKRYRGIVAAYTKMHAIRAQRKAQGLCQFCGQKLPAPLPRDQQMERMKVKAEAVLAKIKEREEKQKSLIASLAEKPTPSETFFIEGTDKTRLILKPKQSNTDAILELLAKNPKEQYTSQRVSYALNRPKFPPAMASIYLRQLTAQKQIQRVGKGLYSALAAPQKNPAAVSLGSLGGSKGGHARAAALTARRRRAIARKAANARWHGEE